jgi:hypothetical protein
MSQSTARASRRKALPKKDKTIPPPTEKMITDQVPAPEPTPMQHPCVIVMRVPGEQPGQEQIQIAPMNGIDELAIPSLLRLAAKIKENQLGLE